MAHRWMKLLLVGAVVSTAACVESREPPARSDQALVPYGPRIYLVDELVNRDNSASLPCTRLGTVATSSSSTIAATDNVGMPIDVAVPHNCFVNAEQRSLPVDVVEVTNELYQLCVDSEACTGPDPSKSERAQFCQTEDKFDVCPVVEIPQSEAANFCFWLGRRLPTTMESIAIRQAGLSNQDPTQLSIFPNGTNDIPMACDDAVTRVTGCMATKPRHVLDDNGVAIGGAARDTVEADRKIFDLMGNASEWTSDRLAARRGNAEGLPWFCIAQLPVISTSSTGMFSAANPPVCPDTIPSMTCVYGQYKPAPDLDLGVWPVCLTNKTGGFSGEIGVLTGGNFRDEGTNLNDARKQFGVFGRRTQSSPDELSGEAVARQYGLRCVDNRASAGADGVVPEFVNKMSLTNLP